MVNKFKFTEANYEQTIIDLLFTNELGYNCTSGSHWQQQCQKNNFRDVICEEILIKALRRLNPEVSDNILNDAVRKLKNIDGVELIERNRQFTEALQNGLSVSYKDEALGDITTKLVCLIDYQRPENNDFRIINQLTIVDKEKKRPDLLIYINGLPLVIIELKSPINENATLTDAYNQIKNYQDAIASLFVYNQICVLSNLYFSKAGTITSNEERYMAWKSLDGSYENTQDAGYEIFFKGLFAKDRLLDILQNFICFDDRGMGDNSNGGGLIKILAAYHQYFAVKKAVKSTLQARERQDGKGGVVWHTQGSGKSLTMVFYAHYITKVMAGATIVVVTDRKDLDDQLYKQFLRCRKFLRQTPKQAESCEHLQQLLEGNRNSGGIIFTNLQKVTEREEALTQRSNIIVMADEAHRSQYGLVKKITSRKNEQGQEEAVVTIGMAGKLRAILPKATYIGFTGTPVAKKDHDTRAVFGDNIDCYDMTQAVEDGATKTIFYESRVVKLKLDEATLNELNKKYEELAEKADFEVIERSKREMGKLDSILGAPQTIEELTKDILSHYEGHRASIVTGKAMIVAYSREIALKIYKSLLKLRPQWKEEGKIAVVMTGSNKDPESWREIIGDKNYKEELACKFKDPNSALKIVIVVDMWLTGFDVPSLTTMYIYKPLVEHNLMQAIARVNRVYKDKEGGLIVDYIGLADALKQAMQEYTARDQKNYANQDIKAAVYPKFQTSLKECRCILDGFEYMSFYAQEDGAKRAKIISQGVDFIFAKALQEQDLPEKERSDYRFLKEAQLLKQAYSLCSSIATENESLEAAYFDAVRHGIKILQNEGRSQKFSLKEINEQVDALLKNCVESSGVATIFSDANSNISLFDTNILQKLAAAEEKNVALRLIKNILGEKVRVFSCKNEVKARQFSEILQSAMQRYLSGVLSNAMAIDEMLKAAQKLDEAMDGDHKLGLNSEEEAFYDILQENCDAAVQEELIAIVRELAAKLPEVCTVDWYNKANCRARVRKEIKTVLKGHNYPAEQIASVADKIVEQCRGYWNE